MKTVAPVLYAWVPFVVVSTILSGTLYIVAQQMLRQGANDPQIQMAEDAARAVENGATVGNVIPSGEVDIAKSLAPFLNDYDVDGKPVAGNGHLNGALPIIPAGVLQYAHDHGEHRLTWQPQPGVRSAVVVIVYRTGAVTGYMVAGRSLREVEAREGQVSMFALLGWLALLVTTFVIVWVRPR